MKHHWFIYFSLIPLLVISLNSQAETLEEIYTGGRYVHAIPNTPGECFDRTGDPWAGNFRLDLVGDFLTIQKDLGFTAFPQFSGQVGVKKYIIGSFVNFKLINKQPPPDCEFSIQQYGFCTGVIDHYESIAGIYDSYNWWSGTLKATYTQKLTYRYEDGRTVYCTSKFIINAGGSNISSIDIHRAAKNAVRTYMDNNFIDVSKDDLKSNSEQRSKNIAMGVRG